MFAHCSHLSTVNHSGQLEIKTLISTGVVAAPSSDPKPYIDVMSAIKTAIHALVFSAISHAAATKQEINKIKNKNIRMYHPTEASTCSRSCHCEVLTPEKMLIQINIVIESK